MHMAWWVSYSAHGLAGKSVAYGPGRSVTNVGASMCRAAVQSHVCRHVHGTFVKFSGGADRSASITCTVQRSAQFAAQRMLVHMH